jgi:hypothetical protein
MEGLRSWLEQIGLAQYASRLEEAEVDLEQ